MQFAAHVVHADLRIVTHFRLGIAVITDLILIGNPIATRMDSARASKHSEVQTTQDASPAAHSPVLRASIAGLNAIMNNPVTADRRFTL